MKKKPSLPFDKPKKKKVSLSKMKAKTWKLFSEWIRRRSANAEGLVYCVACPPEAPPRPWKELHAAHLVPGRRLGILFDDRGVFPCCYGCNVMKHGNYREYDAFMVKMYGKEYTDSLIEDLRMKSKQAVKFTSTDYEALIEKYTMELKKFSV